MTNIEEFAYLGDGCIIEDDVIFINKSRIHIGENVSIESGCVVDARHGKDITIGDGVCIKRGVQLICSGSEFPDGFITIQEMAHIGTYSFLTGHAGLAIGRNCLLGPMVCLNG